MKTPTYQSMASGASPILPPFHQKIFTHATSATFTKDFSDQKNNPFRPWRPLHESSSKPHPAAAGSAKAAMQEYFSKFPFLKFQIPHFESPRESNKTSNRGAGNQDGRGQVQRGQFQNQISPFRPLRPLREPSAFTLIELMAATTVLSVILLMMVGMQDQMSKAWSNANRRTDATREARAAARLMGSDLGGIAFRPNTPNSSYDSFATVLESQGLPYLYSSNGQGSFTITNAQPGSAYLFALCNQASRGTNYTDIGLVGYYIASSGWTNINGFRVTNYNLHRYYVPASNALSNLTSWFTTKNAESLFSGVNPETDDILARNTCNLRITFFGKDVPNGLNYSNSANSSSTYRGNKVQIEWTTYPDDIAQNITPDNWASTANIQKFGRSYEFRLDLRRN
jgi:prepilin-type N-terminal cleavage/methylation domain-containing protein